MSRMSFKVLGLDLSTTSTGICDPNGTATHRAPDKELSAWEKARLLRDDVVALIEWLGGIDFAMLEALGTTVIQSAISNGALHALVCDHLERAGIPYLKCAPSTLKLFATGNGSPSVSKSEMAAAAVRCGYEGGGQDDEVDAWWLWAMGCAVQGVWVVPETDFRRRALVTVTTPPAEKRLNKREAKKARAEAAANRVRATMQREADQRQRAAARRLAELGRLADASIAAQAKLAKANIAFGSAEAKLAAAIARGAGSAAAEDKVAKARAAVAAAEAKLAAADQTLETARAQHTALAA
jgi:hypothetical protein